MSKWAQGPRYLFPRATKERGGTMVEGLGPRWTRLIHNFIALKPFFAKRGNSNWGLSNFPPFFEIQKEKVGSRISVSEFFCETGKKAASAFSELRPESISLGPIGADFARKKVLSYVINDEEVIYISLRIGKGQRKPLFSETRDPIFNFKGSSA